MNQITLFKNYTDILDEGYRAASKTAVLDGVPSQFQAGNGAAEVIVQKMVLQGLSKYDRNTGYKKGSVTVTPTTYKYNYERGRMFIVDNMDNAETAGLAFGRLAGVFQKEHVGPEIDAFRLATYAGKSGIMTVTPAILEGDAVYKALSKASTDMTDNEVYTEGRYLFITAPLKQAVDDMSLTSSRAIMSQFEQIIVIPQSRFHTAIELKEDDDKAGWNPASGANEINFMIVQKDAVLQTLKHVDLKVVTPENNPDMDAWKFGMRIYGLAEVYENKTKGIYLHRSTKTAA